MQITIESFQQSFEQDWDNFIWQANNGTIFHTRQFLNYHPPERFEDHSLIFKKDKRVIALFPATIRYEQHRRILTSHRGASYGGLVTKFNLGIKDTFQVVESLIQYAQDNQYQGVELTPPPIIYYHRPSHYVDFALVKNGFGYRKREISSVIPLTFSEDEVLDTFSSESRRAVRRGVKLGVEVRECEDYEIFYFDRILKIRDRVETPLVLLGCSGLSDSDFKKIVKCGITKINYYANLLLEATDKAKELANSGEDINYMELNYEVMQVFKNAGTA